MTNQEVQKMDNQQEVQAAGKQKMDTGYLVRVALISALAFVVMYFEFSAGALFPGYEYLKIDLSEVIVFIGGVILGPVAVILIELIKNLLFFLLRNSGGVGEMANFTVGVALMLPAVIIIRNSFDKGRLALGFAVGIVTMVLAAFVGNYFVFLPLWGVANPSDRMAMLLPVLLPFNALKGGIVAVLSIIMHFALKPIYRHLR